jgi:hypothetical protein
VSEHLRQVHTRGLEAGNVTPTLGNSVMYLGGFSTHGFLPMVFYFRLRN